VPFNAGVITGDTIVSQSQNAVVYTVASIPYATGYLWSLPAGASGTSNTNSIEVDFSSTAVSGYITVKGYNSCGEGISSELYVTVDQTSKTLELQIFLEGLYSQSIPGTMREAQDQHISHFGTGISDEITVELYVAGSTDIMHFQKTNVMLFTNGSCSITDIPAALNGEYYIVVKHRNSIESWSAQPVSFSGAGPIDYSFTFAASQAYGSNQKAVSGGFYVIFGGDANQDGVVDGSDMALIDNASTYYVTGYIAEDINGDGVVDGSDMSVIDNNSTNFVHRMKP
jgi:hypothetical protein